VGVAASRLLGLSGFAASSVRRPFGRR